MCLGRVALANQCGDIHSADFWVDADVTKVQKCLIDREPNGLSQTPHLLRALMVSDDVAVIELLIESGSDVNYWVWNGLRNHIPLNMTRKPEFLGALIKAGVNLNAKDEIQSTALHDWVKDDYGMRTISQIAEGVRILAAAGAELNHVDQYGLTPLFWASGRSIKSNNPAAVKALLDSGADVNILNHDGQTVLYHHMHQEATNHNVVWLLSNAEKKANSSDKIEKLRSASKKGDSNATYELAMRYRSGLGVEKNLSKALNLLNGAANAGLAKAQFQLGDMYENGLGVVTNKKLAVDWYKKAAELGHIDAQYNLGAMYLPGEGVARDTAKALYWIGLAAEQDHAGARMHWPALVNLLLGQNDANAQYVAGVAHINGNDWAPQDIEVAVHLLKAAATQGHRDAEIKLQELVPEKEDEQSKSDDNDGISDDAKKFIVRAKNGDVEAQFVLGYMYDYGEGLPRDSEKAVHWYTKASEQGEARASYGLGLMYKYGEGVPQNLQQVVYWYTKASEQGDAQAQHELGLMYADGFGVSLDYEQAFYWWKKSAEQAYVRAQYSLGHAHAFGYGVARDVEKAIYWWTMAAEQGDLDAQYNLGHMYSDKGNSAPHNYKQAVFWWTKAAEQGLSTAQNNLGRMYYLGEGVQQNAEQAIYWYTKAAEQGDTQAQASLDQIEIDRTSQDNKQTTQCGDIFTKDYWKSANVEDVQRCVVDTGNVNKWSDAAGTPLQLAVKHSKSLVIVKLLIDGGAIVNKGSWARPAALQIAVLADNLPLVRLLIDAGANSNKGNSKNTPLHIVRSIAVANALVNSGADVNATIQDGFTPLHFVRDVKIATFLIKKGANIHAQNFYGNSPLHSAVQKKNTAIARILINAGAEISVKNNDGKTALDVAQEKGAVKIIEMLQDADVQVNSAQDVESSTAKMFRMMAQAGDSHAQYKLGLLFAEGDEGVPQNTERAIYWLDKAAKQGVEAAVEKLSNFLSQKTQAKEGVSKQIKQTTAINKKESKSNNQASNEVQEIISNANNGNLNDQFELGWMYLDGNGVEQSSKQAVYWWKRAAEKGHAGAQTELAWMYLQADGVEYDLDVAIYWLKKAQAQGYENASEILNGLSDGSNPSASKEVQQIISAAENGNVGAQFELGWIYLDGRGVTQSNLMATQWWREAAQNGHAGAQVELAWTYLDVDGSDYAVEMGVYWLSKAAEQGHEDATDILTGLVDEGLIEY